jgi:hypothetical protein
MKSVFCIGLLLLIGGTAFAQVSPQPKTDNQSAPTSLDPYYGKEKKEKKSSKQKKSAKSSRRSPTIETEQEHYDRMARLVKEKRKIEKDMEKPQYSNPAYFGHKRMPKKHKRGKLKFCKECGIRH